MTRLQEIDAKLKLIRGLLPGRALRLRGSDWFAWATAGASNVVLLTTDTGIAEVLITADEAWILTDAIEAQRLADEELPGGFQLHISPWADASERESKVAAATKGMRVVSDRPHGGEQPLPVALLNAKRILCESEIERYRQVGRLAAEAMRETLLLAQPDWTEYELAAAGARALWARGLHPALTMAAGAERVQRYRHPVAQSALLGRHAMLVFCARGYGLYANLTRFVTFEPMDEPLLERHRDVAEIEAAGLDRCKPKASLADLYFTLERAYSARGYPGEIDNHHQGGTTGYLSREAIATPTQLDRLAVGNAIAINPSLAGAKIEDTFVITEHGLENMTLADWPTFECGTRPRPHILERQ